MASMLASVSMPMAAMEPAPKAAVLKIVCKKGTYTIKSCKTTVKAMAPHRDLFANKPPLKIE